MKKQLLLLACLSLMVSVWACEQPKSPNFKLNHELEVPLTVQKTYPFLGQNDALIDTTSEDYEDLFSPDADGLVRITKEQDFDFGDINDAIPEVDPDPATVNAMVGEIELNNLSSTGSNVGSVSFEDITGSPAPLNEGDPLPAGSASDIQIDDFNPEYFESATIKENGNFELTLTNNLGFNISNLTVTLTSDGANVGSDDITDTTPFENNETATAVISVPAGTQLSNLGAEISASWSNQTMQEDADNLVVNEVTGDGLVASQVSAAIEEQSFSTSQTASIDQNSFEFRKASDFIEIGVNSQEELTISISNNLNIDITSLDLTFHDIQESGNPLTFTLSDADAFNQGDAFLANTSFEHEIDLSGYRILGNNGIDYTVSATTENTQDDSEIATISEGDGVDAQVDINNLTISRAEGYVLRDLVLLNDDQNADGNLDVFNDGEAEITTIDGIDDLSNRVSNITFADPILRTIYNTNLGVNTTVYAVIAGTDANGNTEYLTGTSGSQYMVQDSEIPDQLVVNGQPATESQVIKFPIDTATNPDPQQGEEGENIFDASNTNASEFFSNLPSNIRFVGVAQVNPQEEFGTIVNPVIFDPKLSLDLPLDFSADNATYKDTVEADLSDLPGEGDDSSLSGARLTLQYSNALPLDLGLSITMLDANGQQVVQKNNISINGASVDDDGFVSQPADSELEITFSEDELNTLNQTRNMQLDVTINTPEKKAVRIRKDDSVTLQIQVKTDITSTVN